MDIERLKELKAEFEQVRKYNDRHYMSTVTENDVIALIDEAIARQSVKSEDVQRAIEQMEDALSPRYLESDGEWTGYNEFSTSAIRTAITALQAYQPWIPVSERLPKNSEHDWVLAQITEDNGYMWIPKVMEYRERIGDWYCEELGWLKTHNGTFKVTHWMPLPEPPKGE